jgi:DNA polymerase III delta subunit
MAAATKADPSGPARVILLTGSEADRKTAHANRLVAESVDPDFADFDAETLDGNTVTADRILAGVSMPPIGIGKRVVYIRDTQQMDAEEQKRVAAALDKVAATSLLILHTGSPIYEDGKVKRLSVVTTELTNAVKKSGQIVDFAVPKADDVRAWVLAEARELGKELAPDAVALFSQLPTEDLQRLRSELAKAAAHAGDAPRISGADVEATLSRSPDDVIFKLCDAVGNRRTGEALGHVSTLFKSGARPDAVAPRALVLLARQFRLISQFHYLAENRLIGGNGIAPEIAALLPADGAASILSNPRMKWMADKYVGQARRFSGGELADRMERLLGADLMLKGVSPGGDSPKAVMQRLVAELC